MRMKWGLLTGLALVLGACGTIQTSTASGDRPIVIAHRGASGYLPEHTLAAYQLAMKQGADFIEPDLVMTKDGVLVARHDPYLSDSTDIADHPEFADRKTRIVSPEGQALEDWFVWDFTLAEIKTLRAKQVRAGRDTGYDGAYEIPTFQEILDLVATACVAPGPKEKTEVRASVGLYPETKWPRHHSQRDLDFVPALTGAIAQFEADNKCRAPIYIQSFEAPILQELNDVSDLPLVQLVFPMGWQPGGKPSYELEDLATYADGVGPYKSMVMDLQTGASTGYADRARALGLEVHPWTFRDDDMAPGFDSPQEEINAILGAGATGFFTDFPDTGRQTVDARLR